MEFPARTSPLPAEWSVREARDAYLAENGFSTAEYEARVVRIAALGLVFWLPNPPSRRWAVRFHDLHYVITGYGADPLGEAEISAWEIRRGLGALSWFVRGLVISGALLGAVAAPRRARLAFIASGRAKRSLFDRALREPGAYEALLDLTVGELRERLGVPREGLCTGTRGAQLTACSSPSSQAGRCSSPS